MEAVVQEVKKLAEKRIEAFGYLKKIHLGGSHFFNTVKVTREDLFNFYPNSKMSKR